MIVLLNCSISWSQNNSSYISSTGELIEDSVLVPVSALREANAKMVELKYEKQKNKSLSEIIDNDRVILTQYSCNNYQLKKVNKKLTAERNFFAGSSIVLFIFVLALL